MKSPVVKRSVVIGGHKTSVSMEEAFWQSLKRIAQGRRATLSRLVADIDIHRQQGNLSSAIRLFVLDYYRTKTATQTSIQGSAVVTEGTPAARRPSFAALHEGDDAIGAATVSSRVAP
jgi:predicted DNA-binding ribbon-helix-helix protein